MKVSIKREITFEKLVKISKEEDKYFIYYRDETGNNVIKDEIIMTEYEKVKKLLNGKEML